MIIKNQLKPTMIRTNSRYRGQTEMMKYANFVQEAIHDIKLLSSVMDGNPYTGKLGHSQLIFNNFIKVLNGTSANILSDASSAAKLCHATDNIFEDLDLMDSSWIAYGNCVKSTSNEGVVLESTESVGPCGIGKELLVHEGDVIYIRVGVRLLEGETNSFSLGSNSITNGSTSGDKTSYSLPENNTIIYLDKRLYCQQREAISLNIDLYAVEEVLPVVKVEIVEVQIKYMTERDMVVQPLNTTVKPSVNILQDKIENITNNI